MMWQCFPLGMAYALTDGTLKANQNKSGGDRTHVCPTCGNEVTRTAMVVQCSHCGSNMKRVAGVEVIAALLQTERAAAREIRENEARAFNFRLAARNEDY